MKGKIIDAFSKLTDDTIVNSYHQKLTIFFAAARQSGCFSEACATMDTTMDALMDLFEDSCPASDHSQS